MRLFAILTCLVSCEERVWYNSNHFEDNYPTCGIRYVHKHCWHCICKACQIDLVFLLDFSEDVEPDCDVSGIKDLGIDLFDSIPTSYAGIKKQIDIVKDFLENIENEEIFTNQNIRVGVAIFGQQEEAHEIVNLEHGLSREELICKLYKDWATLEDFDGDSYCSDELVFEQKPLCHKPSVIETLQWLRGEDIFTTSDSILPADMKFRENTLDEPTTRVLVASIADNFLTSNSDQHETYKEEISRVHEQFEAVFTIAHEKDRTRLNELNYQKHLETMACNGLGNQGRCGRVIQLKDYETENSEHYFSSVGEMLAHSILDLNSISLKADTCYNRLMYEICDATPYKTRQMYSRYPYQQPDKCCSELDESGLPVSQVPIPFRSDIQCCDDRDGEVLNQHCTQVNWNEKERKRRAYADL